jgi:hypothetical protein
VLPLAKVAVPVLVKVVNLPVDGVVAPTGELSTVPLTIVTDGFITAILVSPN